jgi:hypothetical protein
MTPQDLQDLKTATRRDILIDISITNSIYDGIGGTDYDLYPYPDHLTPVDDTKNAIEVTPKDGLPTDLPNKPTVKMIGYKIGFTGHTTPIGRTDYFKSIKVFHSYYVPKKYTEEQLETLVRTETKKRLTKLVIPKDVYEWGFTLDCQLLELFKDGKLTMDEVVTRSLASCGI